MVVTMPWNFRKHIKKNKCFKWGYIYKNKKKIKTKHFFKHCLTSLFYLLLKKFERKGPGFSINNNTHLLTWDKIFSEKLFFLGQAFNLNSLNLRRKHNRLFGIPLNFIIILVCLWSIHCKLLSYAAAFIL